MSNNSSSSESGLSFGSVLFLIFLTLKLTHVINWSWWWVTAPLWAGAGIVLLLVAVTVAIAVRGK